MKKIIVVLVLLSTQFYANAKLGGEKTVNVEQYGFSKTNPNNSIPLQKAIDFCGSDAGCKIIIPAGTYSFKSPVLINNSKIIGSADGSTVFILTEDFAFNKTLSSPRKAAFMYNTGYKTIYDESSANTIDIENIHIISNIEQSALYTGTIILLANIKEGKISNCTFKAKRNDSQIHNTVIDIYSCVKNLAIRDCTIANLNEKDSGGGMWIRNLTGKGSNTVNVTENISLNHVTFKHASSDEALSIFGSGGLTQNINIDSCSFYGLVTSTPHSVLVSIYPLNGTGGSFAAVKNVKIQNSTFVDSSYRNYILRVGGSGLKDRGNTCDEILISGNHFYSKAKTNTDKSSVILCVKNIGDNITAINNEINTDNDVLYGIRGFDHVISNRILGHKIMVGVSGSGEVRNNSINARKMGVDKSLSNSGNKISISN